MRSSRALAALLLAVLAVTLSAQQAFVGRWNLTSAGENPAPYWLEVKEEGGKLTAKFLNRGGHPTPVENVRVEGDELVFTFGAANQPQAEFRGKLAGGKLTGTLKRGDRTITLSGGHPPAWPPSNANGQHTYGPPVTLFDGRSLDAFRRRCEQCAALGLTNIYSPTGTTAKFTADDYKIGAENMRNAGEAARQFGMTAMVEAVRASTFISTLPTLLAVTRAAAHPNLKPLLDFYHFWSGNNRLEDLDLIRPGEIGHVHFQDVPDMPRELLDNNTRFIPGDGISPLNTMLRKLVEKGYRGSLSVELFLARLREGDPYDAAREIRQKAEPVMRAAGVL